jgi:hypothetical protein
MPVLILVEDFAPGIFRRDLALKKKQARPQVSEIFPKQL